MDEAMDATTEATTDVTVEDLELVGTEDMSENSAAGWCLGSAGTFGCPSSASSYGCLT